MIIIHFIALFTFILLIFFFLNFFFLFPYFHMLLYYLFFLLNSNIFIVIFTRDWFICFLDVIVYFLCIAKGLAKIMSTELSVIFLYMFLHPFFNANVLLHVTHTCLLFFMGVLAAVISWTSSASSMSDFFLHFFVIL